MRCSGAPGVTALAVRTGLLLGAARDGEALSSGTKRAVCKGVFRVRIFGVLRCEWRFGRKAAFLCPRVSGS